jgi:hypothetical protein
MATGIRWIPTWSKPLGAGGFPVVTAALAYDQYGLPAVQIWEKAVGIAEPVALPFDPENVRVRGQLDVS